MILLSFLILLSFFSYSVSMIIIIIIFNCYLAVPRPTLGHSQGDSLANPVLITVYVRIQPKGHWELRNKVGSLSPAEHLAGFELGTFWFLFQRLSPLGHSPQLYKYIIFLSTCMGSITVRLARQHMDCPDSCIGKLLSLKMHAALMSRSN